MLLKIFSNPPHTLDMIIELPQQYITNTMIIKSQYKEFDCDMNRLKRF